MPSTLRVLYVDDETDLLAIAKLFLEKEGAFVIDTLTSAVVALKQMESERYDAIISDYQMPDMDGISFLKQLKASGNTTPFIIFTGKGREEVVIEALNEGADFYLQKGGEPKAQFAELSNKIRYAVTQRQVEGALRESETSYRHVVEDQTELICRFLPDGTHVFVNDAYCRYFGLNREEIRGTRFHPTIHPEDRVSVSRLIGSLTTEHPLETIDQRIIMPDGSTRWQRWVDHAIFHEDGNLKEYQSVGRDITEQKRAEEALRISEEKFRKAFFTSPDSVCITRLNDGMFISVNKGFTEITGYTEEDIAGKTSLEINIWKDPEDRRKIIEGLQANGEVRNYEARFLTKSGEINGVMSTSIIELNGVPHILNITHDITEQKRAEEALLKKAEELHAVNEELAASEEELRQNIDDLGRSEQALRESEGRLNLAIESAHLGLWDLNVITHEVIHNRQWTEMLGFSRADMDKPSGWWQERVHPDDLAAVLKGNADHLSGSTPYFDVIYRMKHKNGEWRWVHSQGKAVSWDSTGAPLRMIGINQDITDRKRVEEASRESEEKYRSVIEHIHAAVVVHNPDTSIRMINKTALDLLGLTRDEAIGRIAPHPSWHFSGEDGNVLPLADYPVNQVIATQKPFRNMTVGIFRPRSQDTVWVLVHADPEYDERGTITGVIVTFLDITESRISEEALKHQSTMLSILNEIISSANKAEDLPKLLTTMLEESLRLLDFDAGGIYLVDHSTRTADVVHSKNIPSDLLTEIQSVSIDKKPYDTLFIQNEPIITENYAQIAPDRSKKSGFQSMASIPLLSKGVAIGALNIVSSRRYVISEAEKQTLTSIGRELGSTLERMVAEEQAKKVLKNLETLFNSIDEMVFVLDMKGNILAVNAAVQKRLSYSAEELTGTNILLLHVPERRSEALQIVQGMIAGTIDSCPVPVLAKGGERIEVETKVIRGWWNNQEVLIGVTRDVTERNRMIESVRESESHLNSIIRVAPIGIGVVSNRIIQSVNDLLCQMTGYTAEELIGKSSSSLYQTQEEFEYVGREKYGQIAQKGSGSVETRWQKKDGTIIDILLSSTPLDPSDLTTGVTFTALDITERKRVEEALVQANKKLTLLSRITRHDINNQLTVLMGYLGILEKKQPDTTCNEYLQKVSTSAKRISSLIRFTNECEEIGINVPVWQDCRIIVDTAAKEAPLGQVMVKNDLPANKEMFADPLIVKVFYNLMDNAVRYGGKITTIRFSTEKLDGNCVIVCEDDGDGVAVDEKEKIFERGFGKNTGLGLFISREILAITGITITEAGEPGKGARFEMMVPEGMYR